MATLVVGGDADASTRPGVACDASFKSGIVMRSPALSVASTARLLALAISVTGLW